MLSVRIKLCVLPLTFAFLWTTSCAGGLSFDKRNELPDEKISVLAEQIEEVVANTHLDELAASSHNVDRQTGQMTEDLEPLSLIISADEIRRKAPALAELNADTEVMLSAIRARIMRRPAVVEFYQKGCLGENHEGLLQVLKSDWCVGDRHLKNRAAYIVWLENRDRRAIYEQVVKANEFSRSDLDLVREIFARQIHKKAWADTPLQMPDGTWERK